MAGKINKIVRFLEERHSAFAVSRLIMLSGVAVRSYSETSEDDPDALRKIDAVLPSLLSKEDLALLRIVMR